MINFLKKNAVVLGVLSSLFLSIFCFIMLSVGNDKIAYVESSRIFQEYNAAKSEREKLETRSKEFKLKLDTLSREIRETIIRNDGKEDANAKQLVLMKQKQFDDYQRSVQETLQSEEAAAMSKVAAELNSFLKEYGKRNHYKFIFIANPSGTIAYAAEGTNVTEDVLKEINQK
ncbi:OmpH family outer membrane protein [Sphingobacterium faecium]|uniref:OmpH family outer membrane protein n=1 Tax=Sphingobacterium faecium TaxID=34087 RepID=UPI003207DEC2